MSEMLQHLPQGPTATILYEMRIRYREDRAAQAAAQLLKLAGGRMNHMKLIKLLYFADRAALLSSGRPITFDSYVSMPHGPVLSFTLDRINDAAPPDGSSYWHKVISERQGHEVALLGDAPNDQLSPAEEHLLEEIWIRYGHLTQWELRDLSHTLPEWQDPNGSSLPIDIRDILLSEGMTETDAQELLDALHAEVLADRLMTG